MKPHKKLSIAFASAILAAAALSAQEKVAVLPPLAGRNVLEANKKTVRSAFLDYISEHGSGFAAFDRQTIDTMIQRGPAGQPNMLYDEKAARDIGRKLGVPLVCIIDLTRDERELLIECKLVRVDTGRAVSRSGIASGLTNAEIKRASEAAVRDLLAHGGAVLTSSAPTASAAVRAEPATRAAATTTSTPSQAAAVRAEPPSRVAATITATPSQAAAVRAEPPSRVAAPPSDGNDNASKKVNEPTKPSRPVVPKAAPGARGTNWEYLFLDGEFTKKVGLLSSKYDDDMAAVNELGKQGWKLVNSLPKTAPGGKPTQYFYYILSRPQ